MAAKRQKVTKAKKSPAKASANAAKKAPVKKAASLKTLNAPVKDNAKPRSAIGKAVELMAKVKLKLGSPAKPKSVVSKNSEPLDATSSEVASKGKGLTKKSATEKAPINHEIDNAKAALRVQAEPKKAAKSAKKSKKLLIEISANEAISALAAKWNTLHKKAEQIDAKPYNMRAQFEEKTAITHKVLGWGYILTNRNDRLEVLFKDGIKYLISNYKP